MKLFNNLRNQRNLIQRMDLIDSKKQIHQLNQKDMIKLSINLKIYKTLCQNKLQSLCYQARYTKRKVLMIKLITISTWHSIYNQKMHKKLKDLFKVYIIVVVMMKWIFDCLYPYIFKFLFFISIILYESITLLNLICES